jgi:hypothetical protein
MKGSGSEPRTTGSGFRIQDSQKHTDPLPDPGPQNWLESLPAVEVESAEDHERDMDDWGQGQGHVKVSKGAGHQVAYTIVQNRVESESME